MPLEVSVFHFCDIIPFLSLSCNFEWTAGSRKACISSTHHMNFPFCFVKHLRPRPQEVQRTGFLTEKCTKEEHLNEGLTMWPLLLYVAAQEQCELGHDPHILLLLFMG